MTHQICLDAARVQAEDGYLRAFEIPEPNSNLLLVKTKPFFLTPPGACTIHMEHWNTTAASAVDMPTRCLRLLGRKMLACAMWKA